MTPSAPLRIAVLISGRGSNMAAIARACAEGRIAGRIALVVADRADAVGSTLARGLGLPTATVARAEHATRPAFELALQNELDATGADLVVLAGFMRILGDDFVRRWLGRMLNIHPSLLPLHRGLHTHRRALAAAERWHGASVHFVTPELDGGPVVLQGRVPVLAGDDETSLSARVQRCEHRIYPTTVQWYASGRLAWSSAGPLLDGRALAEPIMEDCIDDLTGIH